MIFHGTLILDMNMNHSFIPITSNSGPIFRLSTLRDKDVLISESIDHLPFIRILMIIVCFIIGIGTLINLIVIYIKYKLILKHSIFYKIIVPLILFLNIIFHVAHYAHNIYDPAAYFEPKKLYLKIFISEMEQTFFFNFPLSFVFIIATRKLLLSCTNEYSNSGHMLIMVTLYSLMSMISGGHYTYEPPRNFSMICNITIAGETIVAFVLWIVSIFIYQSNSRKIINYRYTQLTNNDKSKSKLSDNE